MNIIEQDKFDLIYDRRYSGPSWKEEGSYHNIPINEYDKKLDFVITERNIIE